MTIQELFREILEAAREQGLEGALASDLLNFAQRIGLPEEEISEWQVNLD